MQRSHETACLPAPLTSALLRRVLCELPTGTSRAVESCINSYKNRFMSSQDIMEFLRSIAGQSASLRSLFKQHELAAATKPDLDSEPTWEPAAQDSPASQDMEMIMHPSVREPAGPPMGHSVEPPSALLRGPIPSVTDHSAWSMPDGGSGVPLELMFEQEREHATWAAQPAPSFSSSSFSRPLPPSSSSARYATLASSRFDPGQTAPSRFDPGQTAPSRFDPGQTAHHTAMTEPGGGMQGEEEGGCSVPFELQWEQGTELVPSPEELVGQRDLSHGYASTSPDLGQDYASAVGPPDMGQGFRNAPDMSQDALGQYRAPPSSIREPDMGQGFWYMSQPDMVGAAEASKERMEEGGEGREEDKGEQGEGEYSVWHQAPPLFLSRSLSRSLSPSLPPSLPPPAASTYSSVLSVTPNCLPVTPKCFSVTAPDLQPTTMPGGGGAEEEEASVRWGGGGEKEEAMVVVEEEREEEEEGGVEEGKEEEVEQKPKRRRVRPVKISAPPTEEEAELMRGYALRRKAEIQRRRTIARGGARGGGGGGGAGGLVEHAIRGLGERLEGEGKRKLVRLLHSYSAQGMQPEALASGIQTLVDQYQIMIPLPPPKRSSPAPQTRHPSVQLKPAPLPSPPPPMHFYPPHNQGPAVLGEGLNFSGWGALDLGLLPKDSFNNGGGPFLGAGNNGGGVLNHGGGRKRRKKRGQEREAGARCPVCVEGVVDDARWVRCDGCNTWYHHVCVLYNELANGRKLRFFCRTPLCQKRHARQLHRRYRASSRHPLSLLLPHTALSSLLSARVAAVARSDRQVVVREVYCAAASQCFGHGPPSGGHGLGGGNVLSKRGPACECCTRRTVAVFQHTTVTGSDLLVQLLFLDEHVPAQGGGEGSRATVEVAVNGWYEEAAEGEAARVQGAVIEGYLLFLARRGIHHVERREGEGGAQHVICTAEQAGESAQHAERVWAQALAHVQGQEGGRREEAEREQGEGGGQEGRKVECRMMETAPRLGAFLAARQYAFGSLQEAKYASMMLVYHLDQAMAASAALAERAEREKEEDKRAEEEEEEEEEEEGEGGLEAWRRVVESETFRGAVEGREGGLESEGEAPYAMSLPDFGYHGA